MMLVKIAAQIAADQELHGVFTLQLSTSLRYSVKLHHAARLSSFILSLTLWAVIVLGFQKWLFQMRSLLLPALLQVKGQEKHGTLIQNRRHI